MARRRQQGRPRLGHQLGEAPREGDAPQRVPTAVVTVSDTRTLETDTGGALAEELLSSGGHPVVSRTLVPLRARE